jgi:dihydroxyacetone kinase-like protein
MMKKLVNDVNNVVDEELDGLALLYPNSLRRLPHSKIIVRKDSPVSGKVAIIGGGGSGHEPLFGGFVGRGMLDAAVAGEVFSAPPPDQIFSAIRAVNGGNGVLLLFNNYSGDIMNFKLAAEMATENGIEITRVIVNDDVAISSKEMRRGVAGTILVEKIAGAKAELGGSLDEVRRIAERAVNNTRSMGVALTPCVLPRVGTPMFTLDDDEIELGIGVHGEPGVQRTKMKSADEIATILFDRISGDLELKSGEEVVLMVNGMGATTAMELLIFSRKVVQLLDQRAINIFRSFAGNYVTSLDMAGVSLSLLRVDEETKELLLVPDNTPSFPKFV